MLIALSGCVTHPVPVVPSTRVIESIETGYLLLKNIEGAGVSDTESMNAEARVAVRNVECTLVEPRMAVCEYEASKCLDGESDPDADGWCSRTSRFVRVDHPEYPFHVAMIYKGWTVDRAD